MWQDYSRYLRTYVHNRATQRERVCGTISIAYNFISARPKLHTLNFVLYLCTYGYWFRVSLHVRKFQDSLKILLTGEIARSETNKTPPRIHSLLFYTYCFLRLDLYGEVYAIYTFQEKKIYWIGKIVKRWIYPAPQKSNHNAFKTSPFQLSLSGIITNHVPVI